jgi:hypothetical protein
MRDQQHDHNAAAHGNSDLRLPGLIQAQGRGVKKDTQPLSVQLTVQELCMRQIALVAVKSVILHAKLHLIACVFNRFGKPVTNKDVMPIRWHRLKQKKSSKNFSE